MVVFHDWHVVFVRILLIYKFDVLHVKEFGEMWINLVEKLSESRGPKTAQLAENSPDRNWGRIGRWRKALSYLALAKRQAMRKDLVVQGQNKDAAEKLRRKKQQRKSSGYQHFGLSALPWSCQGSHQRGLLEFFLWKTNCKHLKTLKKCQKRIHCVFLA